MWHLLFLECFLRSLKSINKLFKCSNTIPVCQFFFFSALWNSLLKDCPLQKPEWLFFGLVQAVILKFSFVALLFQVSCFPDSHFFFFLYVTPHFTETYGLIASRCLHTWILGEELVCFLLSNPSSAKVSTSNYFVRYHFSVGFPFQKFADNTCALGLL